ncbi:MAG: CBS domain-containing protein [Bdellovibrionales bacterium]|nr:CBS domain-containing protein [Bdellovibrionales bacterium]
MSKAMPVISKYMTTQPHTIGSDQTLEKAGVLMREFHIRHLPVLKGGKIVGILTERDLHLVETLKGVDPKVLTVSEAYTPDPYIVSPQAPLDEVCAEMASHKYGSVLVEDNHKLVGIFTWVDGLVAMSELLGTRLK